MTIEVIPNWHPIFVHFSAALLMISAFLFVVWNLAPATSSWRPHCLTVTAYKGGELVFRHGLGVMSPPQVDVGHHEKGGHGHSH